MTEVTEEPTARPTVVVNPAHIMETQVPDGSVAQASYAAEIDQPLEIDTEDAQPKEVRQFQQLREDMGVSDLVDPLKALLAAPTSPPTDKWKVTRLNTEFIVRGLTSGEYNQIQDRSTRWTRNKRSGRMERDLDANTMSLLVCASGCIQPSFNEPKLMERYQVREAHRVVAHALLPGEIEGLAEKVLEMSGFDTDLEEQGKD